MYGSRLFVRLNFSDEVQWAPIDCRAVYSLPSESPLTSMVVNKVPPSSQEFIHPRSEVQHGEESDQMQFMWWDYRYLF